MLTKLQSSQASVVNPPNRKRARPSNASSVDASSRRQQTAHDGDNTRPQKRNRPSTGAAAGTGGISSNTRAVPSNSRTSAAALLRGPNPQVARNRIGGQESTTAAAAATSRPSLSDVTPSQIQNKPPPRRRSGQTKGARTTSAARKTVAQPQTQRRRQQESSPDEQPISRSQRRDDSDDEDEEEEEEEVEEGEEEEEDDDEGTYPASPTKPYAHVAPYTRRVRQSTIETKWSPLGRGSLKALTSILQLAHRPILQRLVSHSSSESRRAPTEAALQLITKRILTKISGVDAKNIAPLPFPPASLPTRTQRGRPKGGRAEQDGGRETELNFESVLDAKQTLERQLDPVLHAVDLLGEEARRMEEELEADYETLRLLEAEARTRARENRNLLKKAHPLAPEGKMARTTTRDDGEGGSGSGEVDASVKFEKTDGVALNPFQDIQDREIRSLVSTLGERVDTIQDNMAQTEGISDQIQRTRASLQNVLSKKLSAQRYQQVVLGR